MALIPQKQTNCESLTEFLKSLTIFPSASLQMLYTSFLKNNLLITVPSPKNCFSYLGF